MTSTLCGMELESFMVRELPRIADAGSVFVMNHAGMIEQSTAVTNAASMAKPRTGSEGFTLTGT